MMTHTPKGTQLVGALNTVLTDLTEVHEHRYSKTFRHIFREARTFETTAHGLPVRRMRRAFAKKRYSVVTESDIDIKDDTTICSVDDTADQREQDKDMLRRFTRALWFDLSTLPWMNRDEQGQTVFHTTFSEDDERDAVTEALIDMFEHPPAPEIVLFGHYRTGDSKSRLAVGQYIDLENAKVFKGDVAAYTTIMGIYDFDQRIWVLMDDVVVEHSHSKTHKYRPHMVMYALTRVLDSMHEVRLNARTGKPMCESANPPAGTSYKIVQLTPQARERHEHQGGTHASPRKHWRRGHWRHLRNGDRIWIDGMVVGSDERGEVRHDYVVMPEIPETEGLEK